MPESIRAESAKLPAFFVPKIRIFCRVCMQEKTYVKVGIFCEDFL